MGTFIKGDVVVLPVYDRGGRVNDNFCPPIIVQEQFDHVQELTKRNVKCAECDIILLAFYPAHIITAATSIFNAAGAATTVLSGKSL